MKLRLKSSFWEPWHCAFDSDGHEFRLMTNEGPNRKEMVSIFKMVGLQTPIFGYYSDFVKIKYEKERKVVVYDDIESHFGKNKRLVTFSELNVEDKLLYMSEYIQTLQRPLAQYISRSTRYLFVGDYGFQYDYLSHNDWRSNNGRVDFTPLMRLDVPEWRKQIPYAMFAIDFVGEQYELKAIDLNIAPGTIGIGLQHFLSSTQMVLSIKDWLRKYMSGEYE